MIIPNLLLCFFNLGLNVNTVRMVFNSKVVDGGPTEFLKEFTANRLFLHQVQFKFTALVFVWLADQCPGRPWEQVPVARVVLLD